MILYHAISSYQLLEMILYRLKHSEKEESILIITDTLRDKYPTIEKLKEFFNDIWVYEINIKFPKGVAFQTVINNYFNNYFKGKGMGINSFKEINVACAHYYFGHYLTGNSIEFNFFEDAAGILSRPDILINIEKERRPFKCKRNIERGLYNGKSEYVNNVICNVEAQGKNVLSVYSNVINFNVVKELMECSDYDKARIKGIFLEDKIMTIKTGNPVLLTQHFANLKILGFEDQKEIYKLFKDYFYPKDFLIVKPHPDDVMYYELILNNISVMKVNFPSEFLPLLVDGNIDEIATISSTAIKNYYGCGYNLFELNTDFEKTFKSIHKYYVALKLVTQLGKSISLFGCDEVQINALIKRNNEIEKIDIDERATIKLIDDYFELLFANKGKRIKYNDDLLSRIEKRMLNSADEIFVFINSLEYYTFFFKDKEIFKNIVPVRIEFSHQEKKWWDLPDDRKKEEYIYVYSKNKEAINKVRRFSMEKELDNTEIKMSVTNLNDSERQAYEGKIKALEARLKYFIEKEHQDNSTEAKV